MCLFYLATFKAALSCIVYDEKLINALLNAWSSESNYLANNANDYLNYGI